MDLGSSFTASSQGPCYARTGKPFQLHGGGHSERSFIHIQDVVRATLIVMMPNQEALAFVDPRGDQYSHVVHESVTFVVLTSSVVEDGDERLGKDQSYLLDSTAMREYFSRRDQVSLPDGLVDTLEWVDAHLEQIKTLPWHYQHKA